MFCSELLLLALLVMSLLKLIALIRVRRRVCACVFMRALCS